MISYTPTPPARPQTKSLHGHPADGMTSHVDCGDGAWMTIIDPRSFHDGGLEWTLRYTDAKDTKHVAASVIASYDYLLSGAISMAEATRRLKLLRAARRECVNDQ